MQESPVKIDSLLEPLLTATSDEHADEVLSQLIAGHAEPVTAARNLADIETCLRTSARRRNSPKQSRASSTTLAICLSSMNQ
jgi:hypothetical protein